MKLSDNQLDILRHLNMGWELGVIGVCDGTLCFIQKGGVGQGDESENVNLRTYNSLCAKKLIVNKLTNCSIRVFVISELGMQILKGTFQNE